MHIDVTRKQQQFLAATAAEVLFGGAAGGGKSYAQLIDALLYALRYPRSKQLILRRTFAELEKSLIRASLDFYPLDIYRYNDSKHIGRFANGSIIDFGYCDRETDVYQYQSAEYDTIRFDELTHFTEFMYLYLISRLRGANDYPKQVKSSTNPGGVGHQWVKARFIDAAPPGEILQTPTGTRHFIPARVQDNKFLMDADPGYIDRLKNLPENEQKALLLGDWDLFEGQFFPEFSRKIHVCKTFAIPSHWRWYVTMDYGLDMAAVYWIAVDDQMRAYVAREWCAPNTIISDVAREMQARTTEQIAAYLAPPDLWSRRQETGRSVADIFWEHGIPLTQTSNDRVDGWMAVKEWIKPYTDETDTVRAKLTIFDSCVELIRCIPALQYDPHKPSDVATQPHDITHAPDAIRGFCVYWTTAATKVSQARRVEWRPDQWEDYYNASAKDRAYLLQKWGVPKGL